MTTHKKTPFRLLIVDDIHQIFLKTVQDAGFLVDYRPAISLQGALDIIENYEGLIVRSKFKVDRTFIDKGNNLKVIARAGAGIDNIDVTYATHKNIQLISAPEGNCDAVAEHMLGMLLSLLNNLQIGDREIRKGLWLREENRGTELGGKVIGLIGYGNNGRAMARKLSGFDVEVIAYDKYRSNFSDDFAREVDMEEIYERADVLSFHIPLSAETAQLVNVDFLSHFHRSIFFLNGSRGGIVNLNAVLKGLDEGKILGAAFDVLPVEKFPALYSADWYEKLLAHSNVILSPHVAGWTVESYYKIAKILAEKLVDAVEL